MSKSVAKQNQIKLSKAQEEKRKKKEEEKQKRYLNTMITRGEALQMVSNGTEAIREQLKLSHIQVRTLTKVIINKGLATEDELNELSKEVINEIYKGLEAQTEDVKEGTDGQTSDDSTGDSN